MDFSKLRSKPFSWWLQTPLYAARIYRTLLHDRREFKSWEKAGRPAPPPHSIKQRIVRETARRHQLKVLIETGTYKGAMLEAQRKRFDHLYSIELFEPLYQAARERLGKARNVSLLQGDSAIVLPALVQSLDEPALFWLDGHYSGLGTGRGASDSPVLHELAAIANSPHSQKHAVLIDDAREFSGRDGYPTLGQLRVLCAGYWPRHTLQIENDVIRICPPPCGQVLIGSTSSD